MGNIPKLKSKTRANENVGVPNVLKSGEATARAIESGTKQLQGIVKQVGDIVDLKQTQEAQSVARDAEFKLQAYISDDKNELRENYLKQNKGRITGFASWKAQRVQERRNTLSDTIEHRKVQDKFNDTTSYNIRKNFAYDVRTENNIIKSIAKDEADKSLALNVMKVQELTPDTNGDRETEVIQAAALEDIEEKVDLGLLSVSEADNMKDETTDTLAYSRIKSLVRNGNFEGAVKKFQSGRIYIDKDGKATKGATFTTPEMQAKVGDMIEREEIKRLKSVDDTLEKEVQRRRTVKSLHLDAFRATANEASNDSSLSNTQIAKKIKKAREDHKKYIDPSVISQYQKANTRKAIAVTSRLDRLIIGADSNTLEAIIDKAGEYQIALGGNPELYKTIGKTIERAQRTLNSNSKDFTKKFQKKYKTKYEFQEPEFHNSFESHLSRYQKKGWADEYTYPLAELEASRDHIDQAKWGSASEDVPPQSLNLAKIAENIGDFKNPVHQAKERKRLFEEIKKGWKGVQWLTLDSTIEAQADTLIQQAADYSKAAHHYDETKQRLIGNAKSKPLFAEE